MKTKHTMQIEFTVNGKAVALEIEPHLRLVDVLRDRLGLKGAKEGCGEGECGACTVLMDGRAVLSCLVLAVQARGHSIVTVEGLAQGDTLTPLQRSFIDHGAVQCGYCTPGMLLSATALLGENPTPDEEQVRQAIAGNLCRCTGYTKIVEAILAAVQETQA